MRRVSRERLFLGRDHSVGEGEEYVPRKLWTDEEALRWRGISTDNNLTCNCNGLSWDAQKILLQCKCSFGITWNYSKQTQTNQANPKQTQVRHYQQLAGRREDELGVLRGEVSLWKHMLDLKIQIDSSPVYKHVFNTFFVPYPDL